MARFTASIDDNLKDRLDAYAEQHGYNRSQALEVMIRAFFEEGAPAPQPSPPQKPPEEAPSLPVAQPDSGRLDALERRVDELQGALRVKLPRQLTVDMIEMQTKVNEMLIYLFLQHNYLQGLHETVVGNAEAAIEEFSELGRSVEFYVPGTDLPEWTLISGHE